MILEFKSLFSYIENITSHGNLLILVAFFTYLLTCLLFFYENQSNIYMLQILQEKCPEWC